MHHITAICEQTNEYISEFNRLAAKGMAANLETQTESALEALAELAYRLGHGELFSEITSRQHLLELHSPLAPVAAAEPAGMSKAELDAQLNLMLFYAARRDAAINEGRFWWRRAEQITAAECHKEAEKYQQHINDIKAKLLETCHD